MANVMFTRRNGTQVEVKAFTLRAEDVTSLMRLQEDFIARGEHLSLTGVILHVIDKGTTATRNYWAQMEKNKNRRDFAKSAASCFNSDGSIKDAEGLMRLAIAKGLVKGTPKQVPQAVEPEQEDVILDGDVDTEAELEALTAPTQS